MPMRWRNIYILVKLQYANVEPDALKAAQNTATEKRGGPAVVEGYCSIMDTVKKSEIMQKQWKNY